MPGTALADALIDFGAARRAGDSLAAMEHRAPPADPEAERRRAVEAAVAGAEAALTEKLERDYQEKLAAERERHATELEATVARLSEDAGAAIAARFGEMERQVVSLLSAHTARILGVALTEELQKRAVEELARLVKAAMADREAIRVRVRGTALLYEALRSKLGDRAGQVDFTEAPGFDLTAEIDEALFETRLADWSEALAGVLS